jgi:hypothetical protein
MIVWRAVGARPNGRKRPVLWAVHRSAAKWGQIARSLRLRASVLFSPPKGIKKPDTSERNDDWTPDEVFPRMPICAILPTKHRRDGGTEGSGWSRNPLLAIPRSKSTTRSGKLLSFGASAGIRFAGFSRRNQEWSSGDCRRGGLRAAIKLYEYRKASCCGFTGVCGKAVRSVTPILFCWIRGRVLYTTMLRNETSVWTIGKANFGIY